MSREPNDASPQWLTAEQLDAWKSLVLLMARLPVVLEEQLKCDAELSYLEYQAMAGLSDQAGHTMRMSELAQLTNAELSRVSHLMSRLERRGLVRRETDPTDRRFTNAILTNAGYARLVAAAPGHVTKVRELVIDALDPEALESLRFYADQINQQIGCGEARAPSAPEPEPGSTELIPGH